MREILLVGFKPRRKWAVSNHPVTVRTKQQLKVSYIVSPANGQPCGFVPHPRVPGAYLKVDVAVILNECGACGADKCEPCISDRGQYTVGRHVDRCTMSRARRQSLERDKAYLICKDNYIVLLNDVLKR